MNVATAVTRSTPRKLVTTAAALGIEAGAGEPLPHQPAGWPLPRPFCQVGVLCRRLADHHVAPAFRPPDHRRRFRHMPGCDTAGAGSNGGFELVEMVGFGGDHGGPLGWWRVSRAWRQRSFCPDRHSRRILAR